MRCPFEQNMSDRLNGQETISKKNGGSTRFFITSSSSDDGFNPGDVIPNNFKEKLPRDTGAQCSGGNNFPKLTWSNIPEETQALVLIVENIDAQPQWVHLNAYYNRTMNEQLPNGIDKLSGPNTFNITAVEPTFSNGWTVGDNSWSGTGDRPNDGWGGPCPPNETTYRYYFKIYAMNAKITTPINNTLGSVFESSNESQIIASATIFGTVTNENKSGNSNSGNPMISFSLTSSLSDDGFTPGGMIPDNFKERLPRVNGIGMPASQCSGNNDFPKLTWSNIPANAEALVLIVEDTHSSSPWVHLNAWYNKIGTVNLPTELAKLTVPTPASTLTTTSEEPSFPMNWTVGQNSWSGRGERPDTGWGGPCPPSGTGVHNYYFKIYALNTTVTSNINKMKRVDFEAAHASKIIQNAEIFGTSENSNSGNPMISFSLTSSLSDDGFTPGGMIPDNFKERLPRVNGIGMPASQCSGNNDFPKLTWSNIPANAKALVLIVEDTHSSSPWVHLNAWYNKIGTVNLPTELAKLTVPTPASTLTTTSEEPSFPMNWTVGQNSWSGRGERPDTGWGGPCPPSGTGVHNYYFKIYALNTTVTSNINKMKRVDFEAAHASTIIQSAEIFSTSENSNSGNPMISFSLTSSLSDDGFTPGGMIPDNFKERLPRVNGIGMPASQCSGNNDFPKLTWSNIPANAKALVLIVEDTHSSSPWVHLNAWYNKIGTVNLPTELAKLTVPTPASTLTTTSEEPSFPMNWTVGQNSWSGRGERPDTGWGGPCPPSGTGVHNYYFKIYALNTTVTSNINKMKRVDFEAAHASTIIQSAEIFSTSENI